jgi:hypothetical protein
MIFQVLGGSTCDPWQGELQAVADAQVGCELSSLDLRDLMEKMSGKPADIPWFYMEWFMVLFYCLNSHLEDIPNFQTRP